MRRSGLALSTAMALFWAAFLMMAAAIPAHAATWYAAPGRTARDERGRAGRLEDPGRGPLGGGR